MYQKRNVIFLGGNFMTTAELIELINSIPNTDSIFLLEALNSNAGFFSSDSQILYIVKDEFNYDSDGIDTEYLKLQTHVRISSVENNPTFSDGFYNIIVFKGDLSEENNIESFVKLCRVHASNSNELNFKDFFYSLISLFQLPAEEKFKNAVGLFGELMFMKTVFESFGKDLSKFWHLKGPYSKYDFSNGSTSLEIKTTLSEQKEVTIKHQQLFGEDTCYLVAVNCNSSETGKTIAEVIDSLTNIPNAFNSINFSINLAKELKRVSTKDVLESKMVFSGFDVYASYSINPFPSVPDEVSKLTYTLALYSYEPFSQEQLIELLEDY